jgi:hypothetical protein
MPTKREQQLIAQAKAALQINVPIYRIDVKGNKVTFYLYGHTEPVTWTKPRKKRATKVEA